MDKEKQFMKSALVAWVQTFDETVESVKDLADAVIFNRIMHTVDPNTYGLSRVSQTVELFLLDLSQRSTLQKKPRGALYPE